MTDKVDIQQIIEQIHNEFETAADRLLNEAQQIVEESRRKDKSKGLRLAALGFTQARQAKETIELQEKLEMSEKQVEAMREARLKYPLYKYITDRQVDEICEKYGLVHGKIEQYKGFVPEKNLKEIEKFMERHTFNYWGNDDYIVDMSNYFIGKTNPDTDFEHWYHKDDLVGRRTPNNMGWDVTKHFQRNVGDPDFYSSGKIDGVCYSKGRLEKIGLKICAPLKDMDVKRGYRLVGNRIVEIPDPVVLQPLPHEGNLIVSAWGDESEDPLVVNQMWN